jgi:hypothetical protein
MSAHPTYAQLPDPPARLLSWRELIAFGLLGIDLSWAGLWFRIFTQTGLYVSYGRAVSSLAAIALVIYLSARAAVLLEARPTTRILTVLFLALGAYLVGLRWLVYANRPAGLADLLAGPFTAFSRPGLQIPAEFSLAVFILWLAGRCARLAGQSLSYFDANRAFGFGAAALFVYGLIAPLTGEVPLAAAYFFLISALTAMSAGRIYAVRRMRGGQAVRLRSGWLIGLAAGAIGIVTFAGLTAAALQAGLLDLAVMILINIWKVIFLIGMTLMIPILLLVMFLLQFLTGAFEGISMLIRALQEVVNSLAQLVRKLAGGLPEWLRISIHIPNWVFFWGAVAVGLIFLALAARRMELMGQEIDGDDETNLDGVEGLLNRLRSGIAALADRLAALGGRDRGRRMLAAARIRRIYTHLCDLSAALGKPRQAAQTPLEYLPVMMGLFSECPAELERLTAAYLRVRYGEISEDEAELAALEADWERIRREGVQLKKTRRQGRDGPTPAIETSN